MRWLREHAAAGESVVLLMGGSPRGVTVCGPEHCCPALSIDGLNPGLLSSVPYRSPVLSSSGLRDASEALPGDVCNLSSISCFLRTTGASSFNMLLCILVA